MNRWTHKMSTKNLQFSDPNSSWKISNLQFCHDRKFTCMYYVYAFSASVNQKLYINERTSWTMACFLCYVILSHLKYASHLLCWCEITSDFDLDVSKFYQYTTLFILPYLIVPIIQSKRWYIKCQFWRFVHISDNYQDQSPESTELSSSIVHLFS
jgi:hypothetical protein